MKKRKRLARKTHEDDDMSDDDDIDEIKQEAAPGPHVVDPLNVATALPPRDPSIYCGTSAIRGKIDKNTPVVSDYAFASMPPYAAIFIGGVWVSEAFDAGAVFELGNQDDVNTYASIPLDVIGFTPINFKPEGAPRAGFTAIIGKIEGVTELTQGRADFVLLYA